MSDTQIIELDEPQPALPSEPWRAGSLTYLAIPLVVLTAVAAVLGLRGATDRAASGETVLTSTDVSRATAAPSPTNIVRFTPRSGALLESGDPEVLRNLPWSGVGPTVRGRGDVAEAVLGRDAYVIGGTGTTEDGRLVYRYDPQTGMRVRVADLPVSLDHAMAATLGDRIYVFGGFVFGRPSARVFSLTANAATWTEHGPMPVARAAGGAAVVGDRIYIVGGVGEDGNWIRDTWAYDQGGRWWTDLARLPSPRDHLAVGAYRGRVCAAGGNGANQIFQCFDPKTNEWGWMPDLRRPVVGGRAAEVDGWFYVVDQDVHVFTEDRWQFGPRLVTPRAGHALVAIDHVLYVIEGAVGIETARMERIPLIR